MTSSALSPESIREGLKSLPGWQYEDHRIRKEFTFSSYLAGINFVNLVAAVAEAQNHHPDLVVAYRKVQVSYTTHDAGHRVSAKDLAAAELIEALPIHFPRQ